MLKGGQLSYVSITYYHLKLIKDLIFTGSKLVTTAPSDFVRCCSSPLDDELPGVVPQVPMHNPLIHCLQVRPHRFHPGREQEGDLRQRVCTVSSQGSLATKTKRDLNISEMP
ncbi:hypothetical protein P7K49_039998 [Saguinus oedipus]|uniref:Uncharacterized protein n=1 Tax=Saguinus oedipus TaxID=9490 RepID=A0ABQ9TCY0_SAGOE|nr:hypothetical protein P7K49_039998 [Saguinus oedipus]